MNYCVPDMYEMPHGMAGGYTVQGGGEYCMYGGDGSTFGHCESQPLHHNAPCMDQAWQHSQPYPAVYPGAYPGTNPAFKTEFCTMEVPLSHYQQHDYFSDGRPDFSQMQWIEVPHKKGTEDALLDGDAHTP